MKHKLKYRRAVRLWSLALLPLLLSCVQADDVATPELIFPEVQIEGRLITLESLYGMWNQAVNNNGDQFLTLQENDPLYVLGYVISSDEGGNFFEELVIQDSPMAPKRGVKLLLDVSPLYTAYEFGRKVYVKLNGLAVGMDSGVFSIGVRNGNRLGKIPESDAERVLMRDPEVAEIVPLAIDISDFSLEKTNLCIQVDNLQFDRREVLGASNKTFAAEPYDVFDGERILESCSEAATAIMSTSTFADFKAVLLPKGRGSLQGILTMDFFGEVFNLVVNDPTDVNFRTEERCDPDFYVCETPSGGETPIYQEHFEAHSNLEDYLELGWTSANLSDGTTEFEIGNFGDNNYIEISGFNAGEDQIEAWLVTPAVDLGARQEEALFFDVQSNFDNGAELKVLFASDFGGDIRAASWSLLDAAIPIGPPDGFGDFEPVGPINISCLKGLVHFAFMYIGSDPSATTRYHIDNLVIKGQ